MGGSNSTVQQQEYISTNITNVVTETLTAKTTSANQSAGTNQIIRNVVVLPATNCKNGVEGGAVKVGNISSVTMSTILSVQTTSSADLADAVIKELNSALESEVKKVKDGTTASNDDTNVYESTSVSDTTIRNIRNTISTKLDTFMAQDADGRQVIDRVIIPQPCGNSISTITNESYVSMIATDMVSAIMDTVTASEEWKKYAIKMKSVDDQKSNDIFAQARDVLTSWGDNLQNMAVAGVTGGTLIALGVVLLIPLILYMIFRGGGGGGGGYQPLPQQDNGGGGGMDIDSAKSLMSLIPHKK